MKLRLLNTVLLAEDYPKLRDWWMEAVGLELKKEWTTDYHYAELVFDGEYVVGIADATEMKSKPYTPRQNTALPQLVVDDVPGLMEQVKAAGASILFGPAREEKADFWYGAFADIEGNQVWLVSGTGHDDDLS